MVHFFTIFYYLSYPFGLYKLSGFKLSWIIKILSIINGMTLLMSHYPRLYHFMGNRPDLWVQAALSSLNEV